MIRNLVKAGCKACGIELRRYPLFTRAIEMMTLNGETPFFVQVGSNNGIDYDDFYSLVEQFSLPGIVVEPIPYYYASLVEAYKRHGQVTPVRAALHPTSKTATMYRVDPDRVKLGWEHAIASLSRDHLLTNGVSENAIIAEEVECMSFGELLDQYAPGKRIAIVMSDTEGFDAEIMRMVDLETLDPSVVKFESTHLGAADLDEVRSRLLGLDYRVDFVGQDCVAIRKPLTGRLSYFQKKYASL